MDVTSTVAVMVGYTTSHEFGHCCGKSCLFGSELMRNCVSSAISSQNSLSRLIET